MAFDLIDEDLARLHRSVREQEAAQPLPEGWHYRRDFESGPDESGNWRMTVTSTPEPMPLTTEE